MLTADGWFDFAERMPGPADKIWPDANLNQGVVFHSAVGSLQGVINIVLGPTSNYRSVTGVIGYDGRFVQFYPVTASPWANGSHDTNRRFLGFEHEGGVDTPATVSEPLTDAQVAVDVRILKDLAAYKGVGVDYWKRPSTLVEHREIFPTACPSGRIRWDDILAGLTPAPPLPEPPVQAPYLLSFERRDVFSDGTIWAMTGTYDPPPGV